MMAFVYGVIFASASPGSRVSESSTSAMTGTAPTASTAAAEAIQV
jgi:hypothetical protein